MTLRRRHVLAPLSLSIVTASGCGPDPEATFEAFECGERSGIVFEGEIEGDELPAPDKHLVRSGHPHVGFVAEIGSKFWMLAPDLSQDTAWFRFGTGEPWYVSAGGLTAASDKPPSTGPQYLLQNLRRLPSCEDAVPTDIVANYCLDPDGTLCEPGLHWTQDGETTTYELDRSPFPGGRFDGNGTLFIRELDGRTQFEGAVLFPEAKGLAVYCISGTVLQTTIESNTGHWAIDSVARVGVPSEGEAVEGFLVFATCH